MRALRFAFLALSLLGFGGCFAGTAGAQELAVRWLARDGRVIGERSLSLQDLEQLPQTTLKTSTPWTKGEQSFAGPSLAVLAGLAGQPMGEARVTALNDYVATVPAEDWLQHGAILTTRLNGETMRVRDKGPFWVMYPIDADASLAQQYYQSRMVWQVKSVDFIAQ
ncbi:hypothetical protein MWN33_07550 [Starkeya koreensis]|uniref:Oxidoreductase molybdopterin-binding domain-containing protein n=1 Tax=Ancylobacter koreensis TaxID=266121 RepID=A0ABT0DKR9_9HYPH|nr:hypothetical protein [Ancylobacter koreensis]MCK0207886.1 hypothetical protein [Ancylobacter koreensis]